MEEWPFEAHFPLASRPLFKLMCHWTSPRVPSGARMRVLFAYASPQSPPKPDENPQRKRGLQFAKGQAR